MITYTLRLRLYYGETELPTQNPLTSGPTIKLHERQFFSLYL